MIKKTIAAIGILIGLGFMLVPYDALLLYKSKRNFDTSPEPRGDEMVKKSLYSAKATKSRTNIFVIQKHNASHLHYDFRLEIDGVLKSWAVPKGPSTDPHDKRLAMETEDHPMDYANFEGEIPEGNYGAGQVIIWDHGTFDNIKEKDGKSISLQTCYKNGQIEVDLHGKKLQGGYALIRTAPEDAKKWLLIKMRDEHADARRNPVSTEQQSVVSGKTIEEIATTKKKLKT
jgi:DNA ligase D-like protein (predicted 3'-phosphoesterase)